MVTFKNFVWRFRDLYPVVKNLGDQDKLAFKYIFLVFFGLYELIGAGKEFTKVIEYSKNMYLIWSLKVFDVYKYFALNLLKGSKVRRRIFPHAFDLYLLLYGTSTFLPGFLV